MAENNTNDIRSSIVFRSASKTDETDSNSTPQPRSFSLKDYKWVNKYQINGTNDLHSNDAIPKLILMERQPIKKPDWAQLLSSLSAIDSIGGLDKIIQSSLSPVQGLSQSGGAWFLNAKAKEYSSDSDKANELLNISDLERLIEGPVVATYEIPFFNDAYLKSNSKDGWSVGSAMDNAGQAANIINDGFQLNILKTPQWQNQSNDGLDWEIEFHLLNDSLESLQQNFQFIHALFPSTQWIRMKGDFNADKIKSYDDKIKTVLPIYKSATDNAAIPTLEEVVDSVAFTKSPNVFRVECPGRFIQLFVAIDMEVSYVGNVRQMPLETKLTNVPLLKTGSMLYPDAYRVRLSARDLTPNCYNVYANYLMSQEIVTVDHTSSPSRANLSRSF